MSVYPHVYRITRLTLWMCLFVFCRYVESVRHGNAFLSPCRLIFVKGSPCSTWVAMPTPLRRSPRASHRTPRASSCWWGWWRRRWSPRSEVRSCLSSALCLGGFTATQAPHERPTGNWTHDGNRRSFRGVMWRREKNSNVSPKKNKKNETKKHALLLHWSHHRNAPQPWPLTCKNPRGRQCNRKMLEMCLAVVL